MRQRIIILLASICTALSAFSQVIYTCDFEDAAERQAWQLNTGRNAALIASAENKWYIGAAGNHNETGSNGLFVSDDGVQGTYKNTKSFIMFAYRDLELQPGNYTLSFDWIGNTSAVSGEGLYVCVVPTSDPSVGLNSGGQVIPDWVTTYKLNETVLGGAATWQICTSSFTTLAAQGTSFRLVFIWYQNASRVVTSPSIAIDNICLWGSQKCAAPTDISYTITSTALKLTWKGQADYYDIKVYDYQEKKWQYFPKVGSNTLSISNLSEGVHDIFIRSHCGTEESEYVLFKPFYYQRSTRCIDYLSLDDSKAATCYTGNYTNQRQTPYSLKFVDLLHGTEYSGDKAPLFSIHYIPEEYDPYTGNALLTKPSEAVASVRLGRYNPTFGACIEHRYKVPDGDKAILKLRYAVVLPMPHKPEDATKNPQFILSILVDGKAIPNGCGSANFISGEDGTNTWNSFSVGGEEILWQDWSEASVNLRDYVGKTITIRLSTTGCSASVHGGYAYYTLECESGGLSGINCGEVPTTQFVAPSGFDYAWYLPDEPDNILSTNRTFDVDPMDTLTYSVDIISKTNNKCYYTLDATAIPRFPVAEASYEVSDNTCENEVTFHQNCYVKYKNQLTDREWLSDTKVDNIVWDFGDGSEPLVSTNEYVTHTFPKTGGQYTVTLKAGINDTLCTVSTTMQLSFPNIQEKPVLVAADICDGDCYQYNGHIYCNTYIDTISYSSATGCDSIVIFHIVAHEKEFPIKDTLCYGETLNFGGKVLTQSGEYVDSLFNVLTGCDSIIRLSLYAEPQLLVNVPETINICPEESMITIPFSLSTGRLDSVSLLFGPQGCAAGFLPEYTFSSDIQQMILNTPAAIRPDVYAATLAYSTPLCEAPERSIYVQVCYSASIIQQRPHLLMLLNEDYNGGYRFSTYQWYRDGQPVEGGTGSNLAVSANDMGHEYFVVLTREGETTPIRTCSVWYGRTAVDEVPISEIDGPLQVFNALGVYLGEVQHKDELNNLSSGIYIVTNGYKTAKMVR